MLGFLIAPLTNTLRPHFALSKTRLATLSVLVTRCPPVSISGGTSARPVSSRYRRNLSANGLRCRPGFLPVRCHPGQWHSWPMKRSTRRMSNLSRPAPSSASQTAMCLAVLINKLVFLSERPRPSRCSACGAPDDTGIPFRNHIREWRTELFRRHDLSPVSVKTDRNRAYFYVNRISGKGVS